MRIGLESGEWLTECEGVEVWSVQSREEEVDIRARQQK